MILYFKFKVMNQMIWNMDPIHTDTDTIDGRLLLILCVIEQREDGTITLRKVVIYIFTPTIIDGWGIEFGSMVN